MSSAISSLITFDPSLLVSYYNAQLSASTVQPASANTSSSSSSSSSSTTATQTPPWTQAPLKALAQDAKVLNTTDFFASTTTLTPTTGANAKTEQDNNNLFTLYNAVNSLSTLASLAQNKNATAGQLQGYNTRFQQGLQQLNSFLAKTKFNNFTLQSGTPSASVTSTVGVPLPTFGYTGSTIVSDANIGNALANVNSSESFNIAVTKGGATTNVNIDLSQIQGPLTIDNIVSYVNQQLSSAGFSSHFQRTMTQGSISDPTKSAYGITINDAAGEAISLSSASATPSLYLVGNTGISAAQASATASTSTSTSTSSSSKSSASTGDEQGRLIKLSDVNGTPQGTFTATTKPSTGLTTAQSTVVDSQGNIYVLGNATGNFGNQLNQGTQDVYLSKYDSAGNLQWTQMVGSADSASGYSMALNSGGNGVVIAGSTTADLTQTAIANGNTDTFVASYDAGGNQNWVQQIQTLTNNQPTSVSVDSSGNVYVGSTASTVVPTGGNTTVNGTTQGVITELNSSGKVVNSAQIGTTGTNTVAATAITSDGGLVVATVQNGEAYLTKYANGDTSSTPAWQQDLGALNAGGSISGIAVNGSQIYVTGTTTNANLTAGGQATIANAATSSGNNAFVLTATDNGTSATANSISYVGNDGATNAGGITVGSDGTIYLTGTTTGTFAGASRNVTGVNNMFATSISSTGTINWTQEYGGADGQSTGQGIAIDPQGSSVLDALGLPHGTIDTNQSVDLSNATTLRAGDSFSMKIQSAGGAATRTVNITIAAGETMNSLVTKINGELVNAGKASVTYGSAGEELKLQMSSGFTGTLIAGPTDFDALSRLGIQPEVLTNSASSSKTSTSSASTTTSSGTQVYGLGLISGLNISTSTQAGASNATLLNVLSSIRNIYQKSNTPASTTSSTATTNQSTGTVSTQTTAQLADYNLALNLLSSSNTSTSTSTTSSLFGSTSSAGSNTSLIA